MRRDLGPGGGFSLGEKVDDPAVVRIPGQRADEYALMLVQEVAVGKKRMPAEREIDGAFGPGKLQVFWNAAERKLGLHRFAFGTALAEKLPHFRNAQRLEIYLCRDPSVKRLTSGDFRDHEGWGRAAQHHDKVLADQVGKHRLAAVQRRFEGGRAVNDVAVL